ncbi:MAG: HIT domain-containing protein [Acidimicrobiia bacterium]
MSLERLWAGWRSPHVEHASAAHAEPACFLDEAPKLRDTDALILERTATAFVIMNAYPYTTGHMLVAPIRHVSSLLDLDGAEQADVWSLVRQCVDAAERAFHPDGFNVGANLGRGAGAGVPDHLHIHIVPRWTSDTNFMTALADTRVMPETLRSSWERLSAVWPTDSPGLTRPS